MKRILITVLVNLFWLTSFAQTKDIVPTDGITSDLHRANVGKITFMDRNIPVEEYKETDFLATLELKQETNLNIRVFMENSITNYMHQLVPELSADELNLKGNYQFSFFVDNTLIYKENIHHGCGLRKSTTTTFRVPFTDTAGGDWWSIYLFDRFKNNGGEKALTIGTHKLTIELRPYVKMDENSDAKVGDLIASGNLNLIIKTPEITAKQIAIQSIANNSGFETSNSQYDKKKIEELNKSIHQNSFKAITSIVVIKEGKLLLEEYFNKADRNTLHDTRSVGKSFASVLMGIAIKEGYIKDENQTLNTFYDLTKFSNYSAKKDSVKLKDLLTMSSAFNGSDSNSESPGNEENMYPTDNWVKFALDLPMDSLKSNGKQWDYFTAGVVLLGDILNKSVPEGLEKYAEKKLFKPLNIDKYQWQYTPQNVVNTAGGLQMTSLEFAKIGQLYKNKGQWKGQQIVPTEWINKTFTRQIQITEREHEFYGYLFWNKTYTVNGKNYETFYCAGNGGNKIFIFKDVPLTIVITAKAFNRPYGHSQVDKIMEDYILPAILK
ncbi:serine hydrolase [Flavobacterium sp. 11]|jgi:CubicO group peptidase (beta-lactamase class C family)|uniref:serine hydrolase domain-containing protein n=1 Tax=Flavobacterium sp. 11 TaxID=357523 RepID=UPI000C182B03|nr:serine hydrolase [Flavobacterium sp. 11]PIF62153.1 CubicO group peptidase (beta-lactamase class C family) [Flavobacterium sp. 11]